MQTRLTFVPLRYRVWAGWLSKTLAHKRIDMERDNNVNTIANEVIALLEKYDVLVKDVTISKEWTDDLEGQEDETIVENALIEFIPERHVHIGDMCAPGIWQEGSLVDEYSHVIRDFEKASGGKFKVENLKTENPTGDDGEEDAERNMIIEFDHENRHYRWEFSLDDSDEAFDYYIDLAKLFTDVLQEDVIFLGEEVVSAFCIPKELIAELKKYGVDPSANPLSQYVQKAAANCQTDRVKGKSILGRIFNKLLH